MPRRVLLPLRLLLLATAVAAFAVVSVQLAQAEGEAPAGGSVTIAPSDGGAVQTLALADLAPQHDVLGASYTLRTADGGTSDVPVASGISLAALLRAAGLEQDPFSYASIARPDGTGVVVMQDDLGGTDEGPPVVWTDEQGVRFLRPSEGERDANAADLVTLDGGATLAVALRRGDPFVLQIQASTLRARPRERVEFSASLAGGKTLGPGMSFQWYFDGTGRVVGANVTHRFRHAGTYTVLLNVVRGTGESIGDAARVRVRVVRPRAERERDGAERAGESDGGAGDGGSGGGSGGGGGAGGGGAGDGSGTTAGAGGIDPAPQPTRAPASRSPAPTRARAERTPKPSAEPRGELVTGTLLAAVDVAPPPAEEASRLSASAADGDGGDPLDIPVGVWVATGLAVLLALGWTLESRHTLPFWQP